jgi:hypothetical protein
LRPQIEPISADGILVLLFIMRHSLLGLLLGLAANSSMAASLEDLQGAWGSSSSSCDEMFSSKGGKLSLIRNLGNTGFFVNGKRFEGSNATCNVVSTKTSGETLTFALDCRSQIIFDTAVVSVRMIDANRLVRFNPDFPELDSQYQRCRP